MVREHRPDVVHAHSWIVYSFLPSKRSSGASLLWTLHDFGLICARRTFVHQGSLCSGPSLPKCIACSREQYGAAKGAVLSTGMRGARPLLRGVDRFVAVSSAVARGCEHVGAGDRVEVVPNFLADGAADVGLREPRPAFLPDGDFLLFVGELGGHKGADVLLQAHARLGDGAPPLVLIGTPHPDFPPVESNGRVIVVKDVPHPQVMRAWSEASIGVVPSVSPDACPTTAIEALATGTPVVGSVVGGLPEIVIDGETGLLGRPGDVDQLEANLRCLIDDPALRARMRQAAFERAELFAASSVIPRIEAAYHTALGSVPATPPLEARDPVNPKPYHSLGPRPGRKRRRVRSTALYSFAPDRDHADRGADRPCLLPDEGRRQGAPAARCTSASLRMVNYYPETAGWTNLWTEFPESVIDRDMKHAHWLGANTIRVFVQPKVFGFPKPRTQMLDRLEQLLQIAQRTPRPGRGVAVRRLARIRQRRRQRELGPRGPAVACRRPPHRVRRGAERGQPD